MAWLGWIMKRYLLRAARFHTGVGGGGPARLGRKQQGSRYGSLIGYGCCWFRVAGGLFPPHRLEEKLRSPSQCRLVAELYWSEEATSARQAPRLAYLEPCLARSASYLASCWEL